MNKAFASSSVFGLVASALVIGACSSATSDDNTTQGGSGSGGVPATGGTATAGTVGNGGTAGNAGTATSGTGGLIGGAGVTGTAGTGGDTAGTTAGGTGGTAGPDVGGTAGVTAGGSAGTAGTAGTGGAPAGHMSTGCGQLPPAEDTEDAFVKHDIAVTGVSEAYIAAHPLNPADAPYSFTMRNYFLRLPAGYNPATPYRVQFGGPGCGGSATVGNEGGYLPTAHDDVILVSPSYVPTDGSTTATNPGSCFADGATDSPDVQYFDAMLAEIESHYCVNTSQIGVSGYSSGAWEAIMVGWARAGTVRGIATESGGLRHNRPTGTNMPVAALMIAATADTENPINLTPTDAKAISLGADGGSGQARDEILARNGCTGTETAAWDPEFPLCQKYTGCPEAYPVVWCEMDTGGHYPAHTPYTPNAMAKFLGSLPDVP